MVVILAGCDCSGKSTYFGLMQVMKKGQFKKGDKTRSLTSVVEELKEDLKKNNMVVYDRNPLLDDVVYSPIFTGVDSIILKDPALVSELLNKCTIVYFECSNDELERRLELRGDEYIVTDQFTDIKNSYERAFKVLNIVPKRVDTTTTEPFETYKKVEELLK